MLLAEAISMFSFDPSTKVGAVIALGGTPVSMGYNHISPRFKYTESMLDDRAWKYPRTIHAERAALLSAGPLTVNHSIYVTHHPCAACALEIIHSGIGKVITRKPSPEMLERWPGMKDARDLFVDAFVEIKYLTL